MNFAADLREQLNTLIRDASPDEVRFREKAWEAFKFQGLPDKKSESWKYSSSQFLTSRRWPISQPVDQVPSLLQAFVDLWKQDFDPVILLNGHLHNDSAQPLPEGLRVGDWSHGLNLDLEDGVVSAAAAIAKSGYAFELRTSPLRPILIVHWHEGEGVWTPTSNYIRVDSRVHVKVAEVFLSSTGVYLRSDVTKVELLDGAELEWVRLQQESSGATSWADVQTHLAADAQVALTQINAGAEWSRNTLKFDVRGARANVDVSGMTFAGSSSHVDQRVQVSHHIGQTQSTQLFKGILKDRARGVLNGKIYIGPKAQKVVSRQANHNLLLSRTAEADTKPELEIYADDVKANHGATVGRMDDEKLFYLMSRGIQPTEAKRLLAQAFVDEITMKIGHPTLRNFVATRVREFLPEFLAEVHV